MEFAYDEDTYRDEFDEEYGEGAERDDGGYGGDEGEYGDNIYEEEREPEMKADIKAFERVGMGNVLGTEIDLKSLQGKKYNEIISNIRKRGQSPYENFKIYVNAFSLKYIDEGKVELSPQDITNMLNYISFLSNPEYKNPIAFILGYIASNGGKGMDKVTFKRADSALKKIVIDADLNITPPDIIRYAKLWKKLVEK